MLWVPYVSNAGSAIVYDNVCPVPLAFLGSDSVGCCRDDVPFNSFAQVSPPLALPPLSRDIRVRPNTPRVLKQNCV